ncbi:unnamed protein product [Cyclocybe aegerita]|uniref:Uncharacterized protein n=1 Tax=Cyclocybe aegerita TaxID=1973307 RepID=A0A8S0Y0W8_CYCAE|nr:unnamed protein product [Cyclocybe aegerita]
MAKGYTLPFLEYLKLGFERMDEQAVIEKIFEMVELPSLQSLALYGPSTTLLQIRPHILGKLRHLDIKATTYQDGHFIVLMKELQNIRKLATPLPPLCELDALARGELRTRRDQEVYLPKLEHLRLYYSNALWHSDDLTRQESRDRRISYVDIFHSIAESRCEMPRHGPGLNRFERLKSFRLELPSNQTRREMQWQLNERASPGSISPGLLKSSTALKAREWELMRLITGRMLSGDEQVWMQPNIQDKMDSWFTEIENKFKKIKDIRKVNLSELHYALYAFQMLPLRQIEYPPKRETVKKLRLQFRCPGSSAEDWRLEYLSSDRAVRRESFQKEKLRSKMYGFLDQALEQGWDLDRLL